MPFGKICEKHTPIVSKKQRGLFGIIAGRGTPSKYPGLKKSLTKKMAKLHLHEVAGKNLPTRTTGKPWGKLAGVLGKRKVLG